MTWKEAKQEIDHNVGIDTELNTLNKDGSQRSHNRKVVGVHDWGYRVSKGKENTVPVTWEMLKTCWDEMALNQGKYERSVIERHYAEKVTSNPCLVHIVGKMFDVAGLVDSYYDEYYVLKPGLL